MHTFPNPGVDEELSGDRRDQLGLELETPMSHVGMSEHVARRRTDSLRGTIGSSHDPQSPPAGTNRQTPVSRRAFRLTPGRRGKPFAAVASWTRGATR